MLRSDPPGSRNRQAARVGLCWLAACLCFAPPVTLAGPPKPEDKPLPKIIDIPLSLSKPEKDEEPKDKEKDGDKPDSAQDAAQAQETVLVMGQITDYIGSGLADIDVVLRPLLDGNKLGEELGHTTTDDMGEFKIIADKRYQGRTRLTFAKQDYTPLSYDIVISAEGDPDFVADTMMGSLTVGGIILDAVNDKPMKGAKVTLEARYFQWEAETDADGKFSFEQVYEGDGKLTVEAKGYGREQVPVRMTPTDDRGWKIDQLTIVTDPRRGGDTTPALATEAEALITIRLKPERRVTILVVNDLDQPIPGTSVEAYDRRRDDFHSAVTDQAGKVTFRGLHFDVDSLEITLQHPDHVRGKDAQQIIKPPADKPTSEHKLVLKRAGHITGVVIDADNRYPLNGARVVAGDQPDDFAPVAFTDAEGKFTIFSVPAGKAVVTVHRTDYAPELAEVEVKVGETAQQRFKLTPGAIIEGVVRMDEETPIEGAFVEATHWREHATLGIKAITDDKGHFALYDAPRDKFEVTVSSGGYLIARKMIKAADSPFMFEPDGDLADATPPGRPSKLKLNEPAPDFTLTTIDGKKIRLSELKGKVVVLDFWATWCGPCVGELPNLKKLYEKYAKRDDFVLISLSLDYDKKALERFVKKNSMTWPQIYSSEGGAEQLAGEFGAVAIPAMYVIDKEGKLALADGITRQVEATLKKLFNQEE